MICNFSGLSELLWASLGFSLGLWARLDLSGLPWESVCVSGLWVSGLLLSGSALGRLASCMPPTRVRAISVTAMCLHAGMYSGWHPDEIIHIVEPTIHYIYNTIEGRGCLGVRVSPRRGAHFCSFWCSRLGKVMGPQFARGQQQVAPFETFDKITSSTAKVSKTFLEIMSCRARKVQVV